MLAPNHRFEYLTCQVGIILAAMEFAVIAWYPIMDRCLPQRREPECSVTPSTPNGSNVGYHRAEVWSYRLALQVRFLEISVVTHDVIDLMYNLAVDTIVGKVCGISGVRPATSNFVEGQTVNLERLLVDGLSRIVESNDSVLLCESQRPNRCSFDDDSAGQHAAFWM